MWNLQAQPSTLQLDTQSVRSFSAYIRFPFTVPYWDYGPECRQWHIEKEIAFEEQRFDTVIVRIVAICVFSTRSLQRHWSTHAKPDMHIAVELFDSSTTAIHSIPPLVRHLKGRLRDTYTGERMPFIVPVVRPSEVRVLRNGDKL